MYNPENINPIVEVKIQKGKTTATDRRGKIYKIESVMLGAGYHRRAVKYTKDFLDHRDRYRAEVLPNGKLNIL